MGEDGGGGGGEERCTKERREGRPCTKTFIGLCRTSEFWPRSFLAGGLQEEREWEREGREKRRKGRFLLFLSLSRFFDKRMFNPEFASCCRPS